ncbi:MAG: NUDIX hydrolase [Bacteroidaceae bacterium]|nr:NUDIX hydrolase [Bacteroidaceae bacterium]
MPNFYNEYERFFVSVDCVIFGFSGGNLKLLIQKRPYEPGLGEDSLIGGFVGKDESVNSAASRVLTYFTGLENVYMQQLGVFGEVERDPGERVISVVYYALIDVHEYNEHLSEKRNARWIDINDLPRLCLDHNEMVEKARKALKSRINTEPIGSNLLPELFTLSQLQSLHESILGYAVDKRNFRRAVLSHGLIERTEKVDKKSSRRGAALFRFSELRS